MSWRTFTKPSWPVLALIGLLALFVIKGGTSISSKSATWDETHYVGKNSGICSLSV